MSEDIIEATAGPMGRWQLFITLLLFIGKFPISFVTTNIIFIAPKQVETNTSTFVTRSLTDVGSQTLVTEWDLTGEREYLMFMAQLLVMLGVLIGSYTFGQLSDLYGRKKTLVVSSILVIVSRFAMAFAPIYWMFAVTRFLNGFAGGGILILTWVIPMEICGKQYREWLTVIYHVFFLSSYYFCMLLTYLFSNWRHVILSQGVFECIMLLYICLVPESPRWLIAKSKTKEATEILETACKRNGRELLMVASKVQAQIARNEADKASQADRKYTVADLFKTPNLRFNTIGIWCCWFSVGMSYYGILQFTGQSSKNFYMNIAISTTMQIASTFISQPFLKYVGRRFTLLLSNGLCAIAMGITLFLPKDGQIVSYCNIIGLLSINMSWTVVYLYSTELFPTVVRSAGTGMASTISRVGGMLAPVIIMSKTASDLIPPAMFALIPLITTMIVFFMPETLNVPLPETLEDGELMKKSRQK